MPKRLFLAFRIRTAIPNSNLLQIFILSDERNNLRQTLGQRACITVLETPQFTVSPTEAVLVGMAFALFAG